LIVFLSRSTASNQFKNVLIDCGSARPGWLPSLLSSTPINNQQSMKLKNF